MPPRLSALQSAPGVELSWRLPPRHPEREIDWISSSDLADPTPFLQRGQILLTTGTQFPDADARAPVRDYVRRLLDCGVVALGFGTEVVRAGTPDELVSACAELGLPLFEVPYRTPFLALIRWAADEIAREQRTREQWLIDAQRAVSTAALTADGIEAAVRMLGARTGLTVARFDATGSLTSWSAPIAPVDREALEQEMRRLLAGSARAASDLELDGSSAYLQSVGRSTGRRSGLALIGDRVAEREVRFVTDSAVALIEMSLRDGAAASAARLALDASYLELVLAGQGELASRLAERSGLRPPRDPVVSVVGARVAVEADDLRAALPSAIFAPRSGGGTLLCSAVELGALADYARKTGIRIGASGPVHDHRYQRALHDAEAALDLAVRRDIPFVSAADSSDRSLDDLVDPLLARRRATQLLSDAPSLAEARVWLQHHGQFEPAARELGVHRHTLKGRMEALSRHTGLQLDTFAGRSELWILLAAQEAPVAVATSSSS